MENHEHNKEQQLINTMDPHWFSKLAKAYKDQIPVILKDDAKKGIDPINETLFAMGLKAKLGVGEITAACVAIGMSVVGVGIIIAAFLDPEPTSKLGLAIAGGIVLVASGGGTAIYILSNRKPPSVRIGPNGFEINWT
jgi:hypothetical protein